MVDFGEEVFDRGRFGYFEWVEFEDFPGFPHGFSLGGGSAVGDDLFGGDRTFLVPPARTDVGEDGGDLGVGERVALGGA